MKSLLLTFPHSATPSAFSSPCFLLSHPGNRLTLPVWVFPQDFRCGPLELVQQTCLGLATDLCLLLLQRGDTAPQQTCWWRNFECVVFCINFNLLLTLQTEPNQTKPQDNNNKKKHDNLFNSNFLDPFNFILYLYSLAPKVYCLFLLKSLIQPKCLSIVVTMLPIPRILFSKRLNRILNYQDCLPKVLTLFS